MLDGHRLYETVSDLEGVTRDGATCGSKQVSLPKINWL